MLLAILSLILVKHSGKVKHDLWCTFLIIRLLARSNGISWNDKWFFSLLLRSHFSSPEKLFLFLLLRNDSISPPEKYFFFFFKILKVLIKKYFAFKLLEDSRVRKEIKIYQNFVKKIEIEKTISGTCYIFS